MPAALHQQLYAVMPDDNFEINFNLLFTVSYFPNMVLPMFGGGIVDRYGKARCLVAFSAVVFVGHALAAWGVSSASWGAMLSGRLVFGLGAQNLIAANASLISKWFAGSKGVALGLSNVCSYAGVILTNVLSPRVVNLAGRPSFAFGLGVFVQASAIALGLAIVAMDVNRGEEAPKDKTDLVA